MRRRGRRRGEDEGGEMRREGKMRRRGDGGGKIKGGR